MSRKQVTPMDMLEFVLKEGLDREFLVALMNHKGNYSIGEITDKKFRKTGEKVFLNSANYDIHVEITDDEILTAVHNGIYISAFIARKEDTFQVHFLVHRYPESMKARFDEQIADEVIRYMILRTIVVLRLDSEDKIRQYVGF